MSDTTAIVSIFLLSVVCMSGCVVAGVFIGRHYARKCAKSADYCADAHERIAFLVDAIERERGISTDVLPRVHESDTEAPLLTRGQRQRAGGRHGLQDRPPGSATNRPNQP
jgi:hypothetical protein